MTPFRSTLCLRWTTSIHFAPPGTYGTASTRSRRSNRLGRCTQVHCRTVQFGFALVFCRGSASVPAVAKPETPIRLAQRRFADGDSVAARRDLSALAKDAQLSAADRELARDLATRTLIDRGALFVGLSCVGLLLLVVLVTVFKQP